MPMPSAVFILERAFTRAHQAAQRRPPRYPLGWRGAYKYTATHYTADSRGGGGGGQPPTAPAQKREKVIEPSRPNPHTPEAKAATRIEVARRQSMLVPGLRCAWYSPCASRLSVGAYRPGSA
jgi:hypothetical protein